MSKRRAVPSACWSCGGAIAICLLLAAANACAMPAELITRVARSLKGASAGSRGERVLQLLRAGKTDEALPIVEDVVKAKRIENTPEAMARAIELEQAISDLKILVQVEAAEEVLKTTVPEVPKTMKPTLPASERAAAEERKLREAMTVFRSKNVTLEGTTKVLQDARTYTAKADFIVQGQRVSIRCRSAVQAAVDAFVDFINRIFRNGATRTDWTLDEIVSSARQNIMNRFNLSEAQLTVTYIDQFDRTHVVEISLDRSELRFASR